VLNVILPIPAPQYETYGQYVYNIAAGFVVMLSNITLLDVIFVIKLFPK